MSLTHTEYFIHYSSRRGNPDRHISPRTSLLNLVKFQGKVGFRALRRFQNLSRLPKGLKFRGKGGFEQKMSRWEAAQIVAIKYPPLEVKD